MAVTPFDWGAIVRGAVPSAIVAFALLALRTALDPSGAVDGVFVALTLAAFAWAAVLAAQRVTDRVVAHGALASGVASLAVGLVSIPIRLARSSGSTLGAQLVALPLFCLLAMSCGTVAALVIAARSNRSASSGRPAS